MLAQRSLRFSTHTHTHHPRHALGRLQITSAKRFRRSQFGSTHLYQIPLVCSLPCPNIEERNFPRSSNSSLLSNTNSYATSLRLSPLGYLARSCLNLSFYRMTSNRLIILTYTYTQTYRPQTISLRYFMPVQF